MPCVLVYVIEITTEKYTHKLSSLGLVAIKRCYVSNPFVNLDRVLFKRVKSEPRQMSNQMTYIQFCLDLSFGHLPSTFWHRW